MPEVRLNHPANGRRFFSHVIYQEGKDARLGGDIEELAASTNNPNYAAKMLGYNRKIFGDMIHAMKAANDLRGDDNVIWHDNGDVYFNGYVIDNMHSY